MGSFLQQLENNEAVMLMYLAEELPIEDRLEFDQMLAGDARLREALNRLRETHDGVFDRLDDMDKTVPLPVSSGVALRKVSRLMQQRQLEKLVRQVPAIPRKSRNIPKWMYLASSVAAAMVAIVVWWGLKTDSTPLDRDVAQQADQAQQEEQATLVEMTTQNGQLDNARISQVEREVSLLVSRGDTVVPSSSSIFGTSDGEQAQ